MIEISVRNLETGYFNIPVLMDISFEIKEPGIYVVLGNNGAGKTTLFRALSGVLRPYGGSVSINGKSPFYEPEIRRKISYLSHLNAFPEGFRAGEILEIFCKIEGVSRERMVEVSKQLGISDLSGKHMSELSQGQKKRVSIAKSMLREKEIYILDEPTANLDPKVASEIRSLLMNLSEEKIVLYSSHNLYEAREIGSKVIALDDGRLVMFSDIDRIGSDRYVAGIKADGLEKVYQKARKEGGYHILELENADQVQEVIDRLNMAGIRIREIKEMENPLEGLFK